MAKPMIERKTARAFLKRLDEEGTGVAKIASLRVVDLDGDYTEPGAFTQDGEPVVPLLYGHAWSSFPVGKAVIREEGDDVLAYFSLILRGTGGKEMYEYLLHDFQNPPSRAEFSYGFTIPPGGAKTRTLEDGRRVRVLQKIQVHEVSSVIKGAGIDTGLVTVKGVSGHQEMLEYLQGLPSDQQEAWLVAAQALCAEARVFLLDIAFDDLLAGKQDYRFIHTEPWDGRVLLAQSVMAEACSELGCRLPKTFKFFTSCDPEKADFVDAPMDGFCTKAGEIGLSWNLTHEEIVLVAAHEAAHLVGLDEPEASLFGEDFARRHSAKLLGTSPAVDPMEALGALSVIKRWYGPVVPHIRV